MLMSTIQPALEKCAQAISTVAKELKDWEKFQSSQQVKGFSLSLELSEDPAASDKD